MILSKLFDVLLKSDQTTQITIKVGIRSKISIISTLDLSLFSFSSVHVHVYMYVPLSHGMSHHKLAGYDEDEHRNKYNLTK